jgi:hypothetical protein
MTGRRIRRADAATNGAAGTDVLMPDWRLGAWHGGGSERFPF